MKGRCAALLAGVALCSAAAGAVAGDDAAERERIAVEARFVEREQGCARQFVVTACVEEARREQRAALASLRQQQTALDEAQRLQRANARLDKLAKPHVTPPQPPAAPREPRAGHPPADTSLAVPAAADSPSLHGPRPHKSVAPNDPVTRSTEAVARQAAFAARIQAAQAHRNAVEKRQAERSKKARVARPLPAPANAGTP
jgi:colicin import membrane protein